MVHNPINFGHQQKQPPFFLFENNFNFAWANMSQIENERIQIQFKPNWFVNCVLPTTWKHKTNRINQIEKRRAIGVNVVFFSSSSSFFLNRFSMAIDKFHARKRIWIWLCARNLLSVRPSSAKWARSGRGWWQKYKNEMAGNQQTRTFW